MICHSHDDDARRKRTDAASAGKRIKRLDKIPQLISNEIPVVEKEKFESYEKSVFPEGDFTFVDLPFD